MRLSKLQKYILGQCFQNHGRIRRGGFVSFYESAREKPSPDDRVNIITKSMERMIAKGLMIGYGIRTACKWFIQEVRLTQKGKKTAKEVLGRQQKLPF